MALFSWFKRAKSAGPAAAGLEQAQKAPRYNAVEIVPREDACCEAVRAVAGQRFLPEEAPLVPLPDCDEPNCDCTYRRFDDRRNDIRRAGDLGFAVFGIMVQEKNDRRRPAAPGRRSADQDPE
jgi:hypothetical protein